MDEAMHHAVGRSKPFSAISAIAHDVSRGGVTNVVVGCGIALITQLLLFPAFGMHLETGQNVFVAAVFTAVSLIRSFVLRRTFEALRVRKCPRP